MLFEIAIVIVLIVINGVLAMSELAIVSARSGRLKVQAEKGSRGAQMAIDLAADPGRFLSSVQIGITLVGVLSGAVSGATLGTRLVDVLLNMGVSPAIAQPVGMGGVVALITYLSLIVGELVPKQIALGNPEGVAARVAPMMKVISVVAAPIVWFLDKSGKIVLWAMGQSGQKEQSVTDEEIRMLISEAEGAGVIEKAETEMIAGVMRIADRSARGIMTPRHDVEIADANDTRAEMIARFKSSGHSRLPLRDGGPDEIIGVISARDILEDATATFDPRNLVQSAPVIHDSLNALDVIDRLREAPAAMLFVFDEYGNFEGIVTPMDILGAITGGFDEEPEDEPKVFEREDGSLLVAGWMPVDEFADRIGITLDDDRSYATVAGLVLERAGILPGVGDKVEMDGWVVEVMDLDGRRIDKLLVSRKE